MLCNSSMKLCNDSMKLCNNAVIRSTYILERNFTSREKINSTITINNNSYYRWQSPEQKQSAVHLRATLKHLHLSVHSYCSHNELVQSMTVMLLEGWSVLVAIQFGLSSSPNLLGLEDRGRESGPGSSSWTGSRPF